MGTTAEQFIRALTEGHDVIVIAGPAVIALGFNCPTKDAEVWLKPLESPSEWPKFLEKTCVRFPALQSICAPLVFTLTFTQCSPSKTSPKSNQFSSATATACSYAASSLRSIRITTCT